MEISINLLPLSLTHCPSYRLMNWVIFCLSIPVIVDMRLNMDSHIDLNPKICKDVVRSNRFPRFLIGGAVKSNIQCSRSNWIRSNSLRVKICTSYDDIKD